MFRERAVEYKQIHVVVTYTHAHITHTAQHICSHQYPLFRLSYRFDTYSSAGLCWPTTIRDHGLATPSLFQASLFDFHGSFYSYCCLVDYRQTTISSMKIPFKLYCTSLWRAIIDLRPVMLNQISANASVMVVELA